jgi:hypothetical protein
VSTPDVVIKSRARLSLRARDAGASPAFWHRSNSVLRAAGSASEIVFATVAVEDGFGVRRREGLRLLGAVPHPSPEYPRPAPPHPRERQLRIGPRAAPAPWTQRPVARRAIADITPRRQPIGHGGAA